VEKAQGLQALSSYSISADFLLERCLKEAFEDFPTTATGTRLPATEDASSSRISWTPTMSVIFRGPPSFMACRVLSKVPAICRMTQSPLLSHVLEYPLRTRRP